MVQMTRRIVASNFTSIPLHGRNDISGTRPTELARVTPQHVDPERITLIIPPIHGEREPFGPCDLPKRSDL